MLCKNGAYNLLVVCLQNRGVWICRITGQHSSFEPLANDQVGALRERRRVPYVIPMPVAIDGSARLETRGNMCERPSLILPPDYGFDARGCDVMFLENISHVVRDLDRILGGRDVIGYGRRIVLVVFTNAQIKH